ncbi:hypothetical protein [Marinococcus halotolerans]|uniref:hypothetical protein n=1 Tax=Marinococcus halotolerans TaxID=301092 RepID=UPI0003B5A8A7|nr:hypothetical protein [Marinococcus halotolerans]
MPNEQPNTFAHVHINKIFDELRTVKQQCSSIQYRVDHLEQERQRIEEEYEKEIQLLRQEMTYWKQEQQRQRQWARKNLIALSGVFIAIFSPFITFVLTSIL